MQEFLTYLVTNIVKNPADVRVDEVVEGNTFIYNINVNVADMGLIIGKEGRIIKAVRSLAKSKAIKEGVMIRIELIEPEGGKGRSPKPGTEEVEGEVATEVVAEAPMEEVAVEAPAVEEAMVEEPAVEVAEEVVAETEVVEEAPVVEEPMTEEVVAETPVVENDEDLV